ARFAGVARRSPGLAGVGGAEHLAAQTEYDQRMRRRRQHSEVRALIRRATLRPGGAAVRRDQYRSAFADEGELAAVESRDRIQMPAPRRQAARCPRLAAVLRLKIQTVTADGDAVPCIAEPYAEQRLVFFGCETLLVPRRTAVAGGEDQTV